MITAKILVKPGPIIATIPVRSAPILLIAAVVKNVGITVQNIAINRMSSYAWLFICVLVIEWVRKKWIKIPMLAAIKAKHVNRRLPTSSINGLL